MRCDYFGAAAASGTRRPSVSVAHFLLHCLLLESPCRDDVPGEGARDYWDVLFPPRTVLVFGRESDGLPLGIRQSHNDHMLRLPMVDPQLRSLNLANTVAVVLYEVLRQRHRALNSNR